MLVTHPDMTKVLLAALIKLGILTEVNILHILCMAHYMPLLCGDFVGRSSYINERWFSTENVFRMALADAGQRNFRSHYYEKVNLNR